MKRMAGMLVAVMLLLLLGACQSGTSGPTPTPTPTPAERLTFAANEMSTVSSLKFAITRNGDPKVLDMGFFSVGLVSAEGAYQAPDQVHAVIKMQMGGAVQEGQVLWLPEGTYAMLPPMSETFSEFPVEEEFNAPDIFSAETGLPSILKTLEDPVLVGTEEVETYQTYHIRATAQGEELTGLTAIPLAEGEATVDVWIDQATNYVVRVQVTESDGNGWLIDFYDFNEPVDIPQP